MTTRSQPGRQPDARAVLTRAVMRAAGILGIAQQDLARIIGVSPSSISRMPGGRTIDPASKEGELALLFLRVYRSLDTLVGGREEKARAWFGAQNAHLQGIPAQRVRTVEGLLHVAEYLDAMRGTL